MVIFLIVIVAFIVAFHSLYWYYNRDVRDKAESQPRDDTNAEHYFGKSVSFYLYGFNVASHDIMVIMTSGHNHHIIDVISWLTLKSV